MVTKKKTITREKGGNKNKTFADGTCDFKKVYTENRYENPKHVFIVIGDKIMSATGGGEGFTLIDVGGATGELAY